LTVDRSIFGMFSRKTLLHRPKVGLTLPFIFKPVQRIMPSACIRLQLFISFSLSNSFYLATSQETTASPQFQWVLTTK